MATEKKQTIKHFVEKVLLKPAYATMLAGLLVRSVALVLTVAIPYETWPLLVKILIEAFAALGMVVCADIILSVSAASSAAKDRQIDAVRNSSDYLPSPRLSKEKYDRMRAILELRQKTVLSGLTRERQKELFMVLFCGFITTMYGVLFAATVLSKANWISIIVEIVGVAGIPAFTWYLSAQYREEEDAQPEETAKALALSSVDDRLGAAKERFKTGDETNEDLNLMERATEGNPYHMKLVKALRKPDKGVVYLTTPQVYEFFGAADSSKQATIRRIIRKAGQDNKYGVIQNAETGEWLSPKSSLVELFPRFFNPDAGTAIGRHRPSRKRTPSIPQTSQDQEMSEQGSSNGGTPSGAPTSDGQPGATENPEGAGVAVSSGGLAAATATETPPAATEAA